MTDSLRCPFPWYGGKSRVADVVWKFFGDVPNYVEPFAGSLAVLLGRPTAPRTETVNDLDCYISNFWRSVQADPEAVARFADWPVNEADLHARHRWLVGRDDFRQRMHADAEYFDAKVAGWWVWGIAQWIGGGWCSGGGFPKAIRPKEQTPDIYIPRTIHFDRSLEQNRPHLDRGGRGVHGAEAWMARPQLHAGGAGVVGSLKNKRPRLWRGGSGVQGRRPELIGRTLTRNRYEAILEWFQELQARLRAVRVCCGDWQRVLGPTPTTAIGTTGVFLDPPYGRAARRDTRLYPCDSVDIAAACRAWALEHGEDRKLRIALCGYEGEHEMPSSWSTYAWTSTGGYSKLGRGSGRPAGENRTRERIWFSPHCLRPVIEKQMELEVANVEA